MENTGPEDAAATVTVLLDRVRRGDPGAPARLFTVAYDKLREIARGQRRRQPSDTLNTTALVHEAFLKLFGTGTRDFNDRAHFMAVAATAMRQIMIGHARRSIAQKRGGGQAPASFEEVEHALQNATAFEPPAADALLALDGALERLREQSERQSRIVECRFFGGMSIEETAVALNVSPATVKRDWSMAQAWLHREMQRELG
jgi:RNA polymerase sigma factor (TIGR02999 family)